MNLTEYQQLVQGSAAFRELPESLQQNILGAQGERMERFAKIFLSARKALAKAQQDFLKENVRIVNALKRAANQVKKSKRVDDENRSYKADMATAQSLLHNLHTL